MLDIVELIELCVLKDDVLSGRGNDAETPFFHSDMRVRNNKEFKEDSRRLGIGATDLTSGDSVGAPETDEKRSKRSCLSNLYSSSLGPVSSSRWIICKNSLQSTFSISYGKFIKALRQGHPTA